jgi:mRNA interferase MazF
MTTKVKGGTFELPMRGAKRAKGVVRANELRTIDSAERRAEKFDTCPADVLQRIRDIDEALVRG